MKESITSDGGFGEGNESKQSSIINPNNDSPSPAKPFEILENINNFKLPGSGRKSVYQDSKRS